MLNLRYSEVNYNSEPVLMEDDSVVHLETVIRALKTKEMCRGEIARSHCCGGQDPTAAEGRWYKGPRNKGI